MTPSPRARSVQCEVRCVVCGTIVGLGFGPTKREAAYDAGRNPETALGHTRQAHDLKLVFKEEEILG